jgi:hypothetical protein
MNTVQLRFIVSIFIIVAIAGLLTARTVEAAAAPDNQGVPGLQNAVKDLQNTVISLRTLVEGIRTDLAGIKGDLSGLELACTTSDLVPIPVGAAGFSRCDGAGNLNVRVHNQGGGDALESVTQVFFRVPTNGACGAGCAQVDVPTAALPAFSGTNLVVAIPTGCFDVDAICKFKIAVDGTNVLAESGESNNNAAGECGGTIL